MSLKKRFGAKNSRHFAKLFQKTFSMSSRSVFVDVAKRDLVALPSEIQGRIRHQSFVPFNGKIDPALSVLTVCKVDSTAPEAAGTKYYLLDGNHRAAAVDDDDFLFSCRVVDLNINEPMAVAALALTLNSATGAHQAVYSIIYIYYTCI
jgi:hypothetical protein